MYNEIEIHAGHWHVKNSGANGYINEVTEARRVGKQIMIELKNMGIPVSYFEDNASKNQTQNINTLINHHNKDTGSLILSIHFNAFAGLTNRSYGTEVLYNTKQTIAKQVSDAIVKATGYKMNNRGAKKRTDLGVLTKTKEDAILIEVCFVDSKYDVDVYQKHFNDICKSVAQTVAPYVKPQVKVTPDKKYLLIVGSYSSFNNATKEQERLRQMGIKTAVRMVDSVKGQMYRIIAGTYNTFGEVDKAKKTLNRQGVSSFVVKE